MSTVYDDTSLDFQKSIVLHQQYQLLTLLAEANDSLDHKIVGLSQMSAFMVALSGILNITGLIGESRTLIIFGLLVFILIIGLSIITLLPALIHIPGPANWEEVHSKYILVDRDRSFNQILSDCIAASEAAKNINNHKSRYIKYSVALLIMQIGVMLVEVIK